MATPCVSVGLPVYNGEERVGPAIESILSQSFQDFELIISDNASTDRTGQICEAYARRDNRVRYSRNPENIGVNPNHDRVFELARGKYFAWFADDLVYSPGMLERCVNTLKWAPPPVVLVYPHCEMIRDGRAVPFDARQSIECRDPRAHRRLTAVVAHIVMVNQLFGLAKTDALKKTQLNGRYASSDYVLLAELAMLGELWELPETLIRRKIDSDRGTQAVHGNLEAWRKWSGVRHGETVRDLLSYRERLAVEYLLAAWRLPLRPADKLKCLLCILPVYYERMSRSARLVLRLVRPWWRKPGPAKPLVARSITP